MDITIIDDLIGLKLTREEFEVVRSAVRNDVVFNKYSVKSRDIAATLDNEMTWFGNDLLNKGGNPNQTRWLLWHAESESLFEVTDRAEAERNISGACGEDIADVTDMPEWEKRYALS